MMLNNISTKKEPMKTKREIAGPANIRNTIAQTNE
jgi:hypothetical protein